MEISSPTGSSEKILLEKKSLELCIDRQLPPSWKYLTYLNSSALFIYKKCLVVTASKKRLQMTDQRELLKAANLRANEGQSPIRKKMIFLGFLSVPTLLCA